MSTLSLWSKVKTPYYTYAMVLLRILIIDSNILSLFVTLKNIPLECRTVDLSTDEEDGTYDASETKDDQSSSSDSSSSLEEEFSSIGW